MEVSIALFGIPRSNSFAWEFFKRNIIQRLEAFHNVKIFYHFYKGVEIHNPRSGEFGLIPDENYAPYLDYHGVVESPNSCLDRWNFTHIATYGDPWNDNYLSLKNLVHQLNSLYQVTQLVRKERADLVIYARPDLIYHDSLDARAISLFLESPSAVVVPSWAWAGGYNDRFAFCGATSYIAYGERILRIKEYLESTGHALHSERLLKFCLNRASVDVGITNMRASRVRISGEVVKESFSSLRPMGGWASTLECLLAKRWF